MPISRMTGRERVLAAVRRQEVDYVPCSPRFNPLTAPQRVGFEYQFPWKSSGREQIEYCVKELGVAPVIGVGPGSHYPSPDVTSKVWKENGVIHKVWSTPSGDMHAAARQDEKWPYGTDIPLFHDFIDHYTEPWLKTRQDMECLRHILRPADDSQLPKIKAGCEAAKMLADEFGLATVAHIGMGLTGAMQLAGASEICVMAIEQPNLVDDYLELEHRRNMRHIEIAMDFGADVFHRNGYYESSDFYSPDMLDRFLRRRLNEEIRVAHEAGAAAVYTLHTGVMPMLDYLTRLDFDGIFGLDIAFHGVDLPAIASKLGDRMSFWTGPSNTYHMWSEDPEVVRQSVRDVFAAFGKRGLIVTPCPSAHSIMPWRNTLAMIDEWKKLR